MKRTITADLNVLPYVKITVQDIFVIPGSQVVRGAALCSVYFDDNKDVPMDITSDYDGYIEVVLVKQGQQIMDDQDIATIETIPEITLNLTTDFTPTSTFKDEGEDCSLITFANKYVSVILFTQGEIVEEQYCHVGPHLEDWGFPGLNAPQGLWVWEGKVTHVEEITFHGNWRKLTLEEANALRQNINPLYWTAAIAQNGKLVEPAVEAPQPPQSGGWGAIFDSIGKKE